MNQILTKIATAFTLLLLMGYGTSQAQTQFSVDSNLPAVLTAETGDISVQPMYVGAGVPVGTAFSVMGGTPGYFYDWSPAGNFSDPTIASPDFIMQDTTLATIMVAVTDSRGCIARDTVPMDYILPVSDLNKLEIGLEVIPNPNSGIFSVQLTGKPSAKAMDLVVLDALGRSVYAESLAQFSGFMQKDLNLSELSKGIYFLGLYSGDKQVFRKLMIR